MATETYRNGDPARSADPEAVARQLEVVREDLSKLTSQVATIATERARTAASAAQSKASDLQGQLASAVVQNPMAAIGIAAGVGWLLGMMSRR